MIKMYDAQQCSIENKSVLTMPQELRAIEQEIGVEILPGTEVMADVVSFDRRDVRRNVC